MDGLATIPVELVGEMRWYTPSEATSRWGTGHTTGAIEVILGALVDRGPTVDRGVRTSPREDLPFTARPIFFMHGGASVFDKPTEKREVWQPQVSVGGGIGINAARTVSVFAAIEYHSFSFSESSTMDYLMASDHSPIRNPDGVELRGSGSHILGVSAYVKFHPRFGFIRPYLIGSAGYARLDSGTFTVSGPTGSLLPQAQFAVQSATGGGQVENTFAYGGGIGFDLALAGHVRLFVDGRYVETIRGPRYNDVWDRNELINTRFLPFRIEVAHK